jgi:RNA polymerase sigma factor (sigma-70 family)
MSTDPTSSADERFTALLERARQGDSEAMGTLLELFRESLLKAACAQIPGAFQGQVDPDDAVQATFLSAGLHLDRFRRETSKAFSAWLRKILHNTILKFIGKAEGRGHSRAHHEILLDDLPAESEIAVCQEASLCDALVVRETRERSQGCTGLLRESYQRVLELRLDDLGFEKIGEALGISANAARKTYARALHELRELLRANRIIDDEDEKVRTSHGKKIGKTAGARPLLAGWVI